ncbi:hypothetical protein [Caballeronia sp. J97]|uniref:hypothetical protein n=1 Tax=Caballeronia sp. J97 TaxID=2805429 RepID=UPI002AB05B16|nr:hypothetical protein [Caballeronia sp. J97]
MKRNNRWKTFAKTELDKLIESGVVTTQMEAADRLGISLSYLRMIAPLQVAKLVASRKKILRDISITKQQQKFAEFQKSYEALKHLDSISFEKVAARVRDTAHIKFDYKESAFLAKRFKELKAHRSADRKTRRNQVHRDPISTKKPKR